MCTHSQLLTSEKHVSQTRTGFLDEGSGVDFDVHCWQKICLQETQVVTVFIPVMHIPSRYIAKILNTKDLLTRSVDSDAIK